MTDPMTVDAFGNYWFANFGAVMLLGDIHEPYEVMHMAQTGCDWEKECLGSFYIKPNYPGRSSHVCNGGFLVTDGSRNRGVGRLMGEGYLDYAPKLVRSFQAPMLRYKHTDIHQGYTYSVFNLVYETNTPSCRIWDALGFKRIGRVKGCGNLKSYPNQLIDAIIYGRDLGTDDTDLVSEERFERIKFYLKHGRYPDGADRAEKSRLRSASTHYKLIPATETEPEKLVLKGKEVISDPQRQYDVAWRVHSEHHGGINKTTATITERYHWVRIKDTVTQVIKNCAHCKEAPQRALAPYGRREPNAKKTTIPPFDREFSVPPGEKSLWAHGFTADGAPIMDRQPTTPGAQDDLPESQTYQEPDTTAADATFGALMATADSIMPTFPEFPHDENSVPVDPEIMNGGSDTPTNFHQLEQEVRRLQRTQVFGASLFEPKDVQAHMSDIPQQSIEAPQSTSGRRTSRRTTIDMQLTTSPRSSRRNSIQSQQRRMPPQQQPQPRDQELQDGIYVSSATDETVQDMRALAHDDKGSASAPGSKRKQPQDELIGSAELRRVTRRLAANNTPQAGHVSEDAWRRQLNSG
jgi:RimJ/RimL family protein N-acetyltransferase